MVDTECSQVSAHLETRLFQALDIVAARFGYEQVGIHAVWNDGTLFRGDFSLDEIFFHSLRNNDDMPGRPVQKAFESESRFLDLRILKVAKGDGGFGPKIARLEDERNSKAFRSQPRGKTDCQRRGSAHDHIGPCRKDCADSAGKQK